MTRSPLIVSVRLWYAAQIRAPKAKERLDP
jgi:hypothetical protein